MHPSLPSIVEPFVFNDTTFFIKHDEQIHPLLSGNKYRKLFALIQTPSSDYHTLYSYGGVQSNAMLSLAALSHLKGWEFRYLCKTIPEYLLEAPTGNFAQALALGMQVEVVEPIHYDDAVRDLKERDLEGVCIVPQGGADKKAAIGIEVLAKEILQWQQHHGLEHINVVTPSGTGTTAYYLAHAMPNNQVITTAVVGTSTYLFEQIQRLGEKPSNLIMLEKAARLRFGKPDQRLLAIYDALLHGGLEIDLLYGTVMWHTLLAHRSMIKGPILYLHSGGLLGNKSMLERYDYEGLRR